MKVYSPNGKTIAPGERQLISNRSNPHPLPVVWYLGQYIDRCITVTINKPTKKQSEMKMA